MESCHLWGTKLELAFRIGLSLSIMPNILEEYSISGVKSVRARGRSRTTAPSKMELFVIIVNGVQNLPLQVTEVFKIESKFLLNILNKYWSSCHNDFSLSHANGQHAIFFAKLASGVFRILPIIYDKGWFWGDSIITLYPGGRWVYTFFVILRDGKLGGSRWYLTKVHELLLKSVNSFKYFCIIKEKIAYLRCYRTSLDKRLTIMA